MRNCIFVLMIFFGISAQASDSIFQKIPMPIFETVFANALGADSVHVDSLRMYPTFERFPVSAPGTTVGAVSRASSEPNVYDIRFEAQLGDRKFALDCLLREYSGTSHPHPSIPSSYRSIAINQKECLTTSGGRPSNVLAMQAAGFTISGSIENRLNLIDVPIDFLEAIMEQQNKN